MGFLQHAKQIQGERGLVSEQSEESERSFLREADDRAGDATLAERTQAWQRLALEASCYACHTVRRVDVPVCPVCHPPAWMPRGCRTPVACADARRCLQRSDGGAGSDCAHASMTAAGADVGDRGGRDGSQA